MSGPPVSVSVAPCARASSRRSGERSTATRRSAPLSRQPAADDRAETDHPGAEDDACRSGLDLRRVQRRAETGRKAAREQACVLERRLRIDLCERDLGHDGVLGEGGRPHEVADRFAVAAEARHAVRQVALVLLLADRKAQIRAIAAAVDTLAALRREERDDVVARRDRRDVEADALDDSCALVPEHGRRVAGGVGARRGVEVRVADPARDEADEYLAGARLGELDLLHDQRLAELLEYRGADLHRGSLAYRRDRARSGSRGAGRAGHVSVAADAHDLVDRRLACNAEA
jgi:hypothetical protein